MKKYYTLFLNCVGRFAETRALLPLLLVAIVALASCNSDNATSPSAAPGLITSSNSSTASQQMTLADVEEPIYVHTALLFGPEDEIVVAVSEPHPLNTFCNKDFTNGLVFVGGTGRHRFRDIDPGVPDMLSTHSLPAGARFKLSRIPDGCGEIYQIVDLHLPGQ